MSPPERETGPPDGRPASSSSAVGVHSEQHGKDSDQAGQPLDLPATLALLSYEHKVEIRSKTGTAVYGDTAGALLEDHNSSGYFNLDEFDLVTEVHFTKPAGDGSLGTLYDLKHKTIPPLKWSIETILPIGLTIFVGRPKIGKSWLLYGLAGEVAQGVPALGKYETEAGDVLYLALEDGERRMQNRMKLLGLNDLPDEALTRITITYDWPQIDEGGLDQLADYLDEHPDCRVVFIDTWQRFRGDAGSGPDRYAEDYKIAGQIQQLALKHDIAIVMAHHTRKQAADDWIDKVSGTTGITGAADTIWGLFRERGELDATFRITGRDVEETDFALKQDGQRWKSLGDAYLNRITEERREIHQLLVDVGQPLKTGEIAKATGKSVANISKLLHGLAAEQLARSTLYGTWESMPPPVEVVEVVEPPGQPLKTVQPPSNAPVEVVEVQSDSSTTSTGNKDERQTKHPPHAGTSTTSTTPSIEDSPRSQITQEELPEAL